MPKIIKDLQAKEPAKKEVGEKLCKKYAIKVGRNCVEMYAGKYQETW